MDQETLCYAPEGAYDAWTEEERFLLTPFVTNLDDPITILRNIPPEVRGALISRASRSPKSLLRVFLEEYIYPILRGDNLELAEELRSVISFLRINSFDRVANTQRARQFYTKWLAQFGDDSIAQVVGTSGVIRGISQVAMKFTEDQRIGLSWIEKSTRYVNFGQKINGSYLYYVPRPDLEDLGLLVEYCETLDQLFDAYVALQPLLFAWLKGKYNEKESVLEKKVLDTLRGLLPMATLGQVGFDGNAQALEYLVNRTANSGLGELRWLSQALKGELDKEIPSLVERSTGTKAKEYQEYLAKRRKSGVDRLDEGFFVEMGTRPDVRLEEFDPYAEDKILAGIIYGLPLNHASWETTLRIAHDLSEDERRVVFAAHLGERKEKKARWWKVHRGFENSYLRFDIMMNIGAYRDLQRHRMMTQDRQYFSTHHGFDVPKEIIEAGLREAFEAPLCKADWLYGQIMSRNPELAQYVVPLAYRMRFYEWQNFRQFFWEVELRSGQQGHPDYRFIEQEKFRLFAEKFPLIAEFVLADMNDYEFARRGIEEKIADKERAITDSLKKPE